MSASKKTGPPGTRFPMRQVNGKPTRGGSSVHDVAGMAVAVLQPVPCCRGRR
jgi:hypothetical protein